MTIAKIIAGRSADDIISCDITTPLKQAVALLAERRIGAVPVMQDGTVAGIVSERDVIYCLANKEADCLNWPVERIMTSPAMTVTPETAIDEALALMTRRRFRHFPVVSGGQLLAFISIGDLVKHKIDMVEHEAKQMRDYIQTA
ncbi:MAG: CBS domain-containing protein [Erythrobacter sp.]|jgi:CBS domain-containing protein|nr:CBS domain-containing protein [Erythrobacter sp.]